MKERMKKMTRIVFRGKAIMRQCFEPGCRNNWHSHTGGQILVAVGGAGYHQERGKKP